MLAADLSLQQEATAKPSKKGKNKSKAFIPNHYEAYVPFAGNLWKLDGLDKQPRNLGPLSNGEAWINTVRTDIEKRMAVFADDPTAGYSILAIVEDKLPLLTDMLGHNVNHLNWVEHCISEKRDYWNRSIATEADENTWAPGHAPIRGPDPEFGLTQEILQSKGVCWTYDQKKDLSTCSEEHLTWIRPDIVSEQIRLRNLIVPLKEQREAQWAKYRDRMFDYAPVIHLWLEFLEKNGQMERLLRSQMMKEARAMHKNGENIGREFLGKWGLDELVL